MVFLILLLFKDLPFGPCEPRHDLFGILFAIAGLVINLHLLEPLHFCRALVPIDETFFINVGKYLSPRVTSVETHGG